MKHNEIKFAKGSKKNKKRVGRGNASGWGGEAGRGHKGQKSRSGGGVRPGFEGGQMPLYKRIPKLKGIKNRATKEYCIFNLSDVCTYFNDNESVTPEILIEKGLMHRSKMLKILGNGDLNKTVEINAHKFSKTAIEKIDKSKSTYNLIT